MVTKEILSRKNRAISGESLPLLIKNAREVILSFPVYSIKGQTNFKILTGFESTGEFTELESENIAKPGGYSTSLTRFGDFIKIQYDLGHDGECDFAGYAIIKKIE
jgi:hypothetical protein